MRCFLFANEIWYHLRKIFIPEFMQPLLTLSAIECSYRGHPAVSDLSMHVNKGDLVCLLGPSGCGKTTVLRAIAGFEPVTRGEIQLHARCISRPGFVLPPEKRHMGMVFQDYALFPHMNILDNVAFGLRDLSADERRKRANRLLELVGLDGFAGRFPHELSGGQQQRVALARALAPKPDLVLLDEPFSNLDVEMRESLSQEVRRILKEQQTTGVMVTHDQHEAFAVADQIGVMNEGRILQWDTAYNLYHDPADLFVADFIGQGVFLAGTLLAPDTVETDIGIVRGDRAYDWGKGCTVDLLVRPDDILPDPDGELVGEVVNKAFKGAEIMYTLRLSTGTVVLSLFPSHHNHAVGERVNVTLAPDHMVAFPRS